VAIAEIRLYRGQQGLRCLTMPTTIEKHLNNPTRSPTEMSNSLRPLPTAVWAKATGSPSTRHTSSFDS